MSKKYHSLEVKVNWFALLMGIIGFILSTYLIIRFIS